jgi:hypothetical protein
VTGLASLHSQGSCSLTAGGAPAYTLPGQSAPGDQAEHQVDALGERGGAQQTAPADEMNLDREDVDRRPFIYGCVIGRTLVPSD